MSREDPPRLPLSEMVRHWLVHLLDHLGDYRVADLYRLVLEQVERVLIEEALLRSGGRRGKAAEILGLHRNSLRLRMRALGLEKNTRRDETES